MSHASYLTQKAIAHVADQPAGDFGALAAQPIRAGETVAAFGGNVIDRTSLEQLAAGHRTRCIQIDDHLFLAPAEIPEPVDALRHSCRPTCGFAGANLLVAMRDIAVGEALTFDHAMSCSTPYADAECGCGAATCRGKVTGHDWMLPDLQLRYRGYFSPYLARRIASLVAPSASRRAFSL